MSEPFIGEIRLVGFNFEPRGWALCDGRLLSIAQNSALFSLLGTTYGGDGRSTFALPDLRGRAAIGMGQGPGLSSRQPGQVFGAEAVTLTVAQIPPHAHTTQLNLPDESPSSLAPSNPVGYPPSTVDTQTNLVSTTNTGGGQPVPTQPPSLVANYVIALQGIFPSRS